MQTLSTATKTQVADSISHVISYGDAGACMMRAIKVIGRQNLPRDAREMSFAAQDYLAETAESDRNSHELVEHMLTAPRRAEWPA